MASVSGPSSASITPAEYTDSVTISWSGLSFSGSGWTSKNLDFKYRTSADNVNWGGWSAAHSMYSPPGSGSITFPGSYSAMQNLPYVTQGHYVQFMVAAWGYYTSSSYNGATRYVTTMRKVEYTPTTAPTSVSVNAFVSEGNVTLSWSGANHGIGNTISGYEVHYSDSADNVNWGGWAWLTNVGTSATAASIAVAPPGTRGYYRRYQVRTLTANAAYYSGFRVSSNSIRRNILPVAPTAFTASPTQYSTENITLSWSGASSPTSTVKQYVIQKAESDDNVNWGAWTALQTVVTSAGSGSLVVSPTRVPDKYTLYRVATQDAFDCVSGYRNSNSIYSFALPYAPKIMFPKQNAVTYCAQPKILIETLTPKGGRAQTIYVKATNGVVYNSVTHTTMFQPAGSSTTGRKTVFINPSTAPGKYRVSVYCQTVGVSDTVNLDLTVSAAPQWESAVVGGPVKASHMTAIQVAINVTREYYGFSAIGWTQIQAGSSIALWAAHVKQMTAALTDVINRINEYGYKMTVNWLALGAGRPQLAAVTQLRQNVTTM